MSLDGFAKFRTGLNKRRTKALIPGHLEPLESRALLSHQGPALALRALHALRVHIVPMVRLPNNPTGRPPATPPASGASASANASTIIIPFLDRRGVLNVYDSLHNRVVNTGLVATQVRIDAFNQNVLFLTSETAQGRDLDRDHRIDANDNILQIYNVLSGHVINTRVPVSGQYAINTGSLTPLAALLVPEAAIGRDLNHDGDTRDNVAAVYDIQHPVLMNTGQEADAFNFNNNIVTFTTNEARQGQDLNGDGRIDATDTVLQSYDPLRNLPFGLLSNFGKVVNAL